MNGSQVFDLHTLYKEPLLLVPDQIDQIKMQGNNTEKIVWVFQQDFSFRKNNATEILNRILLSSKLSLKDIGVLFLPSAVKVTISDLENHFIGMGVVLVLKNQNQFPALAELNNYKIHHFNNLVLLKSESIEQIDKKENKMLFWNAWQSLLAAKKEL